LFSPVALLLYGAHLVVGGHLTLGSMLAMTALGAGFLGPLSSLVGTAVQLQLVGGYMERIGDILDTPPEQERAGVRSSPTLAGGIRAEAVSFRHDESAPLVLKDVSLSVEPGQMLAIVGLSG